jgi:hypothetical protein
MSYDYRNLAGLLKLGILDRLDLSAWNGLLAKFLHDNPKNSKYQNCH